MGRRKDRRRASSRSSFIKLSAQQSNPLVLFFRGLLAAASAAEAGTVGNGNGPGPVLDPAAQKNHRPESSSARLGEKSGLRPPLTAATANRFGIHTTYPASARWTVLGVAGEISLTFISSGATLKVGVTSTHDVPNTIFKPTRNGIPYKSGIYNWISTLVPMV